MAMLMTEQVRFYYSNNKAQSFLDGLKTVQKHYQFTPMETVKNQGVVSTENYNPVVELMRFYTPFGVKQYNLQLKDKTWADNVLYRQDVSDLKYDEQSGSLDWYQHWEL